MWNKGCKTNVQLLLFSFLSFLFTQCHRSTVSLPRDARHKRGLCRHTVSVRLSVCLSDDEVFMTRSLNVMPKTTDQHLIVCSGKSEAEVTIIQDQRG